jgi:hypothetical protein
MSYKVGYRELKMARRHVLSDAKRKLPGMMALDTTGPNIEAGLVVMQFDPEGAQRFAQEVTNSNLYRVSIARKQYAVDLFAAAIMAGMVYGSRAEQERHAKSGH